jgi:hypothetical protein
MSSIEPHKATFATNLDGKTVAGALNGLLAHFRTNWQSDIEFWIATAYINPGGFALVAGELEQTGGARILIGADPDAPLAKVRKLSEETDDEHLRSALEGHERSLLEDRDLLGFEIEADRSAKRFIEWLRSGKVEVRRYEKGFLHGKAYLVRTQDEGVIAGSSNFTFSGLSRNLELNLGHYHPPIVKEVREWFETLWDDAKDYDLAAVYEARYEPHTPYLVYLRMLYERYGADVEAMAKASGIGMHLAPFQKDGVVLARAILDRYSGVVVADGVGLGKTFVADELLREAIEERRQRVLVIAPAALRDGPWRAFGLDYGLQFECYSFEELANDKRLNPKADGITLRYDPDRYAMVIVDEAHAYRNPATQRAESLSRLLEGQPPKALVMLTATPVNNSLWDLYNLLGYFIRNDAEFAAAGIPSLRERFKEATNLDPDTLSPEFLFNVLETVVVRRTRRYVKTYYRNATITDRDGVEHRITFPTPEVVPVRYDIDSAFPGFFDAFAIALGAEHDSDGHPLEWDGDGDPPELTLARYRPSGYRLDGDEEQHEGQVAGLLRSGLLKRFESSAHAFANTCERMADSHDLFVAHLDEGWVATGEALTELAASDSDDWEDLIAELELDAHPASEYDAEALRADVESDRDLLRGWAAMAHTLTPNDDPKLRALADELAAIAEQAEADVTLASTEGDRRKVIVFSYYADTVQWITEWLKDRAERDPRLHAFRGRIASVTGSGGDTKQTDALWGFAPNSSEAPEGYEDTFDVLVATDVLAEGVNLQQARHIINYDLPWNPMRLVQRHGRIDRIGSPHTRVFMRCFMPDTKLDGLLDLEARLHRKIAQATKSVGVEGTVLPGAVTGEEVVFSKEREDIERIARGDASVLDEAEAEGGLSVEELRQQLRRGLEDPLRAERVKALPWGSGSGMAVDGAERGFVFCAKVGDHPDAVFRYVQLPDGEDPIVVPDTLAALTHAQADPDTHRVLDEETLQGAYGAWSLARADIHRQWMVASDPRNLQPEIPKVMRDAADTVRANPVGWDVAKVDLLVGTLESPYSERVRKEVRDALRTSGSPVEQAMALEEAVARLGLRPPEPPEPLPVIDPDDVNLVCWQAIVPTPTTEQTE